jgi:glycosyltransferase involved in cell wall biosynthesis
MQPSVTIVIPAWNEAHTIGTTLRALRQTMDNVSAYASRQEIIVVDDGSSDDTFRQALPLADHVVRHRTNRGKGASLDSGWRTARGDIVVFLDADLGESAIYTPGLIEPVVLDEADMAIAMLPSPARRGGFGLVKNLAVQGIYRLSGYKAAAPLSGQRAIRKAVLERIGKLSNGFGIEVGLTIDAARAGYRICEVPVPFRHRETGRDWAGFCHRGKQFISVGKTLVHKWRRPTC